MSDNTAASSENTTDARDEFFGGADFPMPTLATETETESGALVERNPLAEAIYGQPRSDYGNALRLHKHTNLGNEAYGDLVYVQDREAWLEWDLIDAYWKYSSDGSAAERRWFRTTEFMAAKAQEMIAEAKGSDDESDAKAASAYLKWAYDSQNRSRVAAAVHTASTLHEFRISAKELDRDDNLLQFKGGVVNLETGEVTSAERSMFHTRTTGVEYIPGARSELLEGFLNRMFAGDAEKIEWLRGMLHTALYGGNLNRLIVFLTGPSSSGKSTLLALMRRAFGEYQTTFSMSMLRGNFDEKARPDLARVLDYRVVTSEEISDSEELHADQIKRLVGGEGEISVRTLFKGEIAVTPNFLPIVAMNNLPTIKGADNALLNRLRVVETADARFTGEDVIPLNDPAVTAAFLSWVIEGPKLDYSNRNDVPATGHEDAEAVDSLMYGFLAGWVDEYCTTGDKDEVWGFPSALYASAKEWYEKEEGYGAKRPTELENSTRFGKWMRLHFENKQKKVNVEGSDKTAPKPVYLGIGLKGDTQPVYRPSKI